MTTINDISDLVRVLEERPDWRAAVRNLLLGEDMLNVPQQLAQLIETTNQFIETTNENFRLVNETLQAHSEMLQEHRLRLNRMEGRQGNMEGHIYDQRIANRAMLRARRHFGLNNPVIAMSQYLPHSPEFDRALSRATESGAISDDDMYDLYEADLIVSDGDNRYVVFEMSITVDNDNIERAARRAEVISLISGSESMAAVATANLPEPQQALAQQMNVAVFIIPNR